MGLTFPQLLAGAIGALLIYAAINKETPVAVVKKALSNSATPAPAATPEKPPVVTTPNAPSAKYKP